MNYDYGARHANFIEKTRLNGYSGPYSDAMGVASALRHKVPRARSLLFHGTTFVRSILSTRAIESSIAGVSFTRELHVAVHFALLIHDEPSEFKHFSRGAVLVFDRERMRADFQLRPVDEGDCEKVRAEGSGEAEELAAYNYIPLQPYLIGLIRLPVLLHDRGGRFFE